MKDQGSAGEFSLRLICKSKTMASRISNIDFSKLKPTLITPSNFGMFRPPFWRNLLTISVHPGWDACPSPGYPQHTHLYTWVERGTVIVKCLAQEHSLWGHCFSLPSFLKKNAEVMLCWLNSSRPELFNRKSERESQPIANCSIVRDCISCKEFTKHMWLAGPCEHIIAFAAGRFDG